MSIMIREYERVFYTRGQARDLFGGVRKSWERNQGGGKEAQKFSIRTLSRVCAHSKQQHLQTREMCLGTGAAPTLLPSY